MNYKEFIEKRETLKRLIKSERTGTAEELADRLCFSRRTLFNYIDSLKDEGFSIKFCRYRNSYYFDDSMENNKKS